MNVAQSPRGCAGPSRHGYLRATLTGSTLGPPSQAPNLSNLRATTVTCSLRHSLERPFWPQATDIPIIPPQAASQSLLPKSAGLQANMDLSKRDSMELPEADRAFLETHLPSSRSTSRPDLPFTTLTFATSLDSALALAPGTRTVLSGPQSKAMTHYLRSRHDGILIGVGTALADDPGLNCRIAGEEGTVDKVSKGNPVRLSLILVHDGTSQRIVNSFNYAHKGKVEHLGL
ncbi:hypothetical protein N7470_008517 [Penicillium chermesinum]|nr:hypothetical protein N7470_008517 [Penicillium chermesinum]